MLYKKWYCTYDLTCSLLNKVTNEFEIIDIDQFFVHMFLAYRIVHHRFTNSVVIHLYNNDDVHFANCVLYVHSLEYEYLKNVEV